MTVKLYEGCYGITRAGDVVGPIERQDRGDMPWLCPENFWRYDSGNLYSDMESHRDITAVYATRAEAEAALAKAEGKTLEAVWPKRNVKVLPGETPLNGDLGHPLLDVFKAGELARDNGTPSPYSGHSLEHCLHAAGWVKRDLRLALDAAQARLSEATPATAPAPDAARDERLDAAAECLKTLRDYVSDARDGHLVYKRGIFNVEMAQGDLDRIDALLAALEARQ